jgi:hypothetical protein
MHAAVAGNNHRLSQATLYTLPPGTCLYAAPQVAGALDVVVVVSRWFGGVLLGPARFAAINNTARQLLEAQVGRVGMQLIGA